MREERKELRKKINELRKEREKINSEILDAQKKLEETNEFKVGNCYRLKSCCVKVLGYDKNRDLYAVISYDESVLFSLCRQPSFYMTGIKTSWYQFPEIEDDEWEEISEEEFKEGAKNFFELLLTLTI